MKILKKVLALILVALIIILSFPTVGFGASSDDTLETGENYEEKITNSEDDYQEKDYMNAQSEIVMLESVSDETSTSVKEISKDESNDLEEETVLDVNAQSEIEFSYENTEEETDNNTIDEKQNNKDESVVVKQGEKENLESEDGKDSVDEIESSSDEATIVSSMRPLKTITAYLILTEKTDEDLRNMSLDTVLSSLVDSDGNAFDFPMDADTVWRYVKDEQDGVEKYEKYVIGNEETIDLSVAPNVLDFQLELIVGTGNQLNPNNQRYIITVYVSDYFNDEFSFEFYNQPDENTRVKVEPIDSSSAIFDSVLDDKPGCVYKYQMEPGTYKFYVGVTSEIDFRPDVDLKVYELNQY